jgi:CMP-N-acetylneuraminic acid synthetase
MPMMYETPALESFDIDTPDDWEFAAIAAKSKQEKNQR